jgi:hypothetical protein
MAAVLTLSCKLIVLQLPLHAIDAIDHASHEPSSLIDRQ